MGWAPCHYPACPVSGKPNEEILWVIRILRPALDGGSGVQYVRDGTTRNDRMWKQRRVWAQAGQIAAIIVATAGAADAVCLDPRGDVNGDGTASISDVQCGILAVLWDVGGQMGALPACIGDEPERANADCGNGITVIDAQLLIFYTLGLPPDPSVDSDGDLCPDACGFGCAVNPASCDDSNPCTADECTNTGECTNSVVTCGGPGEADCDIDECVTTCVPPNPTNTCFETVCSNNPPFPPICVPKPVPCEPVCTTTCIEAVGCDDGQPCSLDDYCDADQCISGPTDNACDDGIGCTVDSCDPDVGCMHLPDDAGCADSTGCNTGTCDAELGCQYVGVAGPACDSGLPCSEATCVLSQASALTCAELGWENAAAKGNPEICGDSDDASLACSGAIDYPAAVAHCEAVGARLCTVTEMMNDETQGTGCGYDGQRVWTSTPCDGGQIGVAGSSSALDDFPPVCLGGGNAVVRCCADTSPAPAPTACVPTEFFCDDGDPCTLDSCDFASGCQTQPASCDDGNVCTDDVCLTGIGCEHIANSEDCEDGFDCTLIDTCDGGQCIGGLPFDLACFPEFDCIDATCDTALGCLFELNDDNCDDGDVCTDELCTADAGCANPSASFLPCDDGVGCTADSCDPASGCVFSPVDALCDDGVECTVGTCESGAGCQFEPFDELCDDGVDCTQDFCALGAGCLAPINDDLCDDGFDCTDDICDEIAGCSNFPFDPLCDDGVECTVDACSPASGCSSSADDALCDDDTDCTTDTCDATTGCSYAPNVAFCDDGDACTEDFCDPAQASAATCAELGWTGGLGSAEVCGETDGPAVGPCSGDVTWAQAEAFCTAGGARLCTLNELVENETVGTGCGYDSRRVWSSTACGPGAYLSTSGNASSSSTHPIECSDASAVAIVARCCADATPAAAVDSCTSLPVDCD